MTRAACSRPVALLALAALALVTVACGKEGPPLAPLRLVPAPANDVAGIRSAQAVELRFVLPTANANGPGVIDLEHVEIYAVTVAAGAPPPPNRDLLIKARIVGTIAVKPPPVQGKEPVEGAPVDKRPAAGDRVTFVEELTEEKLKPVVLPPPPTAKPVAAAATGAAATAATPTPAPTEPAATAAVPPPTSVTPTGQAAAVPPIAPPPTAPAPTTPPPTTGAETTPPTGQTPPAGQPAAGQTTPGAPAVAPVAPAPIGFPYPTRVYSIRGISRGGRPGVPSARITVPLVSPVPPVSGVVAQMPTEKAIVIEWTAPAPEAGAPPPAFNLYAGKATTPVNATPLAEAKFEQATVEYGKEVCFTVRTIRTIQNVTLESDPSAPACLTPRDTFAPAAPKGLRAVAEDGAVSLVWDQNSEADLAGYVVLRADVEGGTLQPITPKPIKDANYRDTGVKAGVRYTYVVVAVDTAATPNTSGRSNQESVTAR